MARPAPDRGRPPVETITLSCGHRLTPHTVARPLVWPGSVTRCPTCTVPRTISRVESSPAVSGGPNCGHDDTTRPRKILIFDDGGDF